MRYKIGVDGGATKTECILVDSAGRIVARSVVQGCNPNAVGDESARRILTEALEGVRAKVPAARPSRGRRVGPVDATLLCMAGSRPFWRDFARGLVGFGRVIAVDDSLPVLELATEGQPGLVLHAGTGSFVAARGGKPGKGAFGAVHYAGGLGWRLGDAGSGSDLGRRAIAAALLELQGWTPRSGLTSLVRKHTGLDDVAAITRAFYTVAGADPRVPALAPGLLNLAARGDSGALAVIDASMADLLELALRVATTLFPERCQGHSVNSQDMTPSRAPVQLRVGVTGPILTHRTVLKILRARSPLSFTPIGERPIEGVRRLLAYL